MPSDNGQTSPESKQDGCNNDAILSRMTSQDSSYLQRTRISRTAPPKPACNPLQFVQVKPCNLYQSAQEQIKRAEEVKKVKEIKKEEPEDWQSNLDNWKSCRRKRVEHIIERVVEVKKLELEEHDKGRRKSKTFSEMLEERNIKGRKASLAVYATEADPNDLSDLGIGASSTSEKSSLSEDFDNQSVISDNQENEKSNSDLETICNNENGNGGNREYISSPGYDTSSSTAPASSPDPGEYTYEGAIQDYKSRVLRAQTSSGLKNNNSEYLKDFVPNIILDDAPSIPILSPSAINAMDNNSVSSKPTPTRHILNPLLRKNELNLSNNIIDENNENVIIKNTDLPNVDVTKRREIFEKSNEIVKDASIIKLNRLTHEINSSQTIRDRLATITAINPIPSNTTKIDVEVVPLKDRLNRLQSISDNNEEQNKVMKTDKFVLQNVKSEEIPVKDYDNAATNLNDDNYSPNPQDNQLDKDKFAELNNTNINISQNDSENDVVNPFNMNTKNKYSEETVNTLLTEMTCNENQENLKIKNSYNDNTTNFTESTSITNNYRNNEPVLIPISETFPVSTLNTNNITEQKSISPITYPSISETFEQDSSVIEALEIALHAIDVEKQLMTENIQNKNEPIYENLNEIADKINNGRVLESKENIEEPYYQVPKKVPEPLYEVPKQKPPVAIYENIDIYYSMNLNNNSYMENSNNYPNKSNKPQLQPPNEKPPPPPIDDDLTDDDVEEIFNNSNKHGQNFYEQNQTNNEIKQQQSIKRTDSTKRIRKELRNKRSSFLGIETSNIDDDNFLDVPVTSPPDLTIFNNKEIKMHTNVGLYDSSDTVESRDSGVSENHSRQSSEPLTSSEEQDNLISNSINENSFIHNNSLIQQQQINKKIEDKPTESIIQNTNNYYNKNEVLNQVKVENRTGILEDEIREQEEVLRVERELLQLEQEELKRQRQNLINRNNNLLALRDQNVNFINTTNRFSLEDIKAIDTNTTENYVYQQRHSLYSDINDPIISDYRQSMPNLPQILKTELSNSQQNINHLPLRTSTIRNSRMPSANNNFQQNNVNLMTTNSASNQDKYKDVQTRNSSLPLLFKQTEQNVPHQLTTNTQYGNMTKHTLHAISAAPKPRLQDNWVQIKRNSDQNFQNNREIKQYNNPIIDDTYSIARVNDSRYQQQQIRPKRLSDPQYFNYNNHWVIQEAEQRRIEQQRSGNSTSINEYRKQYHPHNNNRNSSTFTNIERNGIHDNKPLPESVIQTLTQRVQNKLNADKKKYEKHHSIVIFPNLSPPQNNFPLNSHRDILSISGKKKCSNCGEELGRGAAMIIESLCLFFHLDCFKCCVCRILLGDGVSGVDVRVRNNKLHCHNCYSGDDGVKFSCV